jgi:Domain of unknown function (DU1801)
MKSNMINDFLDTIVDEQRRNDSRTLIQMMQDATDSAPVLWGSIIGFGTHHYVYETGREGDTMAVGFAPRKNALVLYGVVDYDHNLDGLSELGKHKLGEGCLYITKLSDVDTNVLKRMITSAYTVRNTST